MRYLTLGIILTLAGISAVVSPPILNYITEPPISKMLPSLPVETPPIFWILGIILIPMGLILIGQSQVVNKDAHTPLMLVSFALVVLTIIFVVSFIIGPHI